MPRYINKTNNSISWTDFTWNPLTGCRHNCHYCYGEVFARRFPKAFPNGWEPTFHPDRIDAPARLHGPPRTRKPWLAKAFPDTALIFTVSMGDLFGAWVPPAWQDAVFHTIEQNPQHIFQVLTKDPAMMNQAVLRYWKGHPPSNFWRGTTIESQDTAYRRGCLPAYSRTGILFISFEPLLGPVTMDLDGIDWIIIGAQTDPLKLPDPAWVDQIIMEARRSGTAVFLKESILKHMDFPAYREFPRKEGCTHE